MAGRNGWGLIGTGRIADERILPGINAFEGNELVAVTSRDQGRADTFARKFGAKHAYTRYEDMLRNPDVTVVAIHTPNSMHAEQIIAAARAGKHVFCDKPMTTSVADAERAIAECEQAGVKLGMNFHNRYMPPFIDAKRIVESGEIGDVNLVHMEVSPGARPGGRLATWRVDPVLAGLGTTMSIGVHAYDILRYILGSEIVTVTALFDTPRNVMEEMNLSLFKFANGAMAHLSVHENSPFPHNDFVIYGTKGRITGRGLTRSRAGGVMEVMTARRQHAPAGICADECARGVRRRVQQGAARRARPEPVRYRRPAQHSADRSDGEVGVGRHAREARVVDWANR